eukprot:m.141773 g.141773  ORF g.141773 m.141773 type:complete len:178 (+) comp16138_c0_seq1:1534-2067(+)
MVHLTLQLNSTLNIRAAHDGNGDSVLPLPSVYLGVLSATATALARWPGLTSVMSLNMLMSAIACANLADRSVNAVCFIYLLGATYCVSVLKRLTTSLRLKFTNGRPSCVSAKSTRIAVPKPCTFNLPHSRHVEHSTQSMINEMLRNLLRKSISNSSFSGLLNMSDSSNVLGQVLGAD